MALSAPSKRCKKQKLAEEELSDPGLDDVQLDSLLNCLVDTSVPPALDDAAPSADEDPNLALDELLVENGAAPIGWEAILDKSDPAPLDESLIEPLDEPTQMYSVDEPAGEPGVVELDD